MITQHDQISALEARIAELERRRTSRLPQLSRRLVLVAFALALVIPTSVMAAGRFSDVPSSNKFAADIEAIAAAGITGGCSATRYCPDGLVTRGQMAAFLNRLGALGPGRQPKVNADKVDGYNANDLARVASFRTDASIELPLSGTIRYRQYGPDLVITAPRAGFVTINASFMLRASSDCTFFCRVTGSLYHFESGAEFFDAEAWVPANASASTSMHEVFPVNAGVNTFRLYLERVSTSGNGSITTSLATATALFVPFGSTGGSTP